MTLIRTLSLSGAALLLAAAPAASGWTATTAAAAETSQATTYAASVTMKAKCQLVNYKVGTVVGYVTGTGTASNYSLARTAAIRDATSKAPVGHYVRHCSVTSA